MPGALGVNLVRQYRQAGLAGTPFLSTFTVDEATLPAQGDAALGFLTASTWAPGFDDPRSRHFVQAFEAAYGVKWPKAVAKITDDAEELTSAFAGLIPPPQETVPLVAPPARPSRARPGEVPGIPGGAGRTARQPLVPSR